MSTHKIHFHNKIGKFPKNISLSFVFLSYRKNFLGTLKKEFESATLYEPSLFESLKFC